MATNVPMIAALDNYSRDLFKLFLHLRAGKIPPASKLDEVEAWTRLLQQHIKAQKKQGGQYPNDSYAYDSTSKKIERHREGKVVSKI